MLALDWWFSQLWCLLKVLPSCWKTAVEQQLVTGVPKFSKAISTGRLQAIVSKFSQIVATSNEKEIPIYTADAGP